MTVDVYDVIVIGGGAGGVAAAIRSAQLGGKTAVIEDKHLGGLCMNRGCVPFGHMMAASHIIGNLTLGKEMGIECSGIRTDFAVLMKRQNELISFMRQGVRGMFNKHGVTLISGKGKLAGPGKVDVSGKTLKGRKIILATGGIWLKPDFPDSDLDEVVNSDYLLTAERLPERCLLFGENPMIIEIAQFLNRFGSKVTLATKANSLLSDESKVIRTRLAKALNKQGIEVLTRSEILALRRKKNGLHATIKTKDKEETVVVDRVVSLRRGASLEGLGLETVRLDEKREFIEVNDRMETEVSGIYAIGDLAAPETRHYSHLASAGGIVAAENAMGLGSIFNYRTVPRAAFTEPQVACVGLTGREAKKAGYDVMVGTAPLSMNPFGMIISQNEGIVEVVAEKKYGEVLGIHIIGEGACEMAGQAVLAIQMEATLEDLVKAIFPHPTLSESLAEAARDCLGRSLYLP